jgi:hypothetical protein
MAQTMFPSSSMPCMIKAQSDLPSQCGELRLIVGLAGPHRIEQASADLLDLFQLSAAQCIGRTMCVLSGPDTQQETLMGLIDEAAAFGKQARAVVMLYSRSGAGERFCVTCRPYFSPMREMVGVMLEMTPFKDPFSLKMAAQDDGLAKAIVQVEAPHRAVFCSPEFEALYGVPEPCVVGRTLNIIHGPNTDQHTWARLLESASCGVADCAILVTATSDCRELEIMIKMQPIVNASGFITHVLVVTTPHLSSDNKLCGADSCSGVCDEEAVQDAQDEAEYSLHQVNQEDDESASYPSTTSTLCGAVHDYPMHSVELHPSCVVMHSNANTSISVGYFDPELAPSMCGLEFDAQYGMPPRGALAWDMWAGPAAAKTNECAGRPPHGVARPAHTSSVNVSTVMPRRKAGQECAQAAAPVVISKETLEQYKDIPLSKVAAKLGISTTAMKKACRKLGVTRWPYNSTCAPKPAPKVANADATHVDTAYVRKIFRKHAGGNAKITDFSLDSLRAALQHTPHTPYTPPALVSSLSRASSSPPAGQMC